MRKQTPHLLGSKGLGVLLAGLLALAGCRDRRQSFSVSGSEPSSAPHHTEVSLSVQGFFPPAIEVDYAHEDRSVFSVAYAAWLGEVPLEDVYVDGTAQLRARVPALLAPGSYALKIRAPWGEELTLEASFQALPDVAPPVALGFATGPHVVGSNACSPQVLIRAVDATGLATQVGSDTAVTLSSSRAGTQFFSDSACANAASSLLLVGASPVAFHFKEPAAGDLVLTASAAGLGSVQQTHQVTPAPAAALVFVSPPRTLTAGVCSGGLGRITVRIEDGFGNTVAAGPAGVDLTAASSSPSGSWFFDASCTTPAPGGVFQIPSGLTQAQLYYQDTQAGTPSVSLTNTAGLANPLPQVETVLAAPAARVTFGTPSRTFTSGACPGASEVITAQLEDSFGNLSTAATAMTLTASSSSSGAVDWFLDSGCVSAAALGQFSLAAGLSSVDLYYRDTAAGTPFISLVNSAGLPGPPPQQHTVLAAAATQLGFSTPERTFTVNLCAAANEVITVTLLDSFGNPTPAGAGGVDFWASSSSSGTASWFSDPVCAVPAASGSFSIAAGLSSVDLYYYDTALGSPVVSVTNSAGLIDPAPQTHLVQPLTASKVAFTSAPPSQSAGACSAELTVRLESSRGIPVPASAATQVDLRSSSAAAIFYSDPACSTPATQLTISAGLDSASFYFQDAQPGTSTLTASSAGLSPGTLAATITSAGPVVLCQDSNASAGAGSGSRTVVSSAGSTYAFCYDGTQLVFRVSADRQTFGSPVPVLSAPATLGFSVAATGTKLGVVFSGLSSGTHSITYAEATFGAGSLNFGSPQVIASSTDLRGYQPVLAYSSGGLPVISGIDYGHAYAGGTGAGCGTGNNTYRPGPYYFNGTSWSFLGYCKGWSATRDPSSSAIAALGNGRVIAGALVSKNLSTSIIDPTLGLSANAVGEPWSVRSNATLTLGSSLSLSGSASSATDVHALYVTELGKISYARQDGTQTSATYTSADAMEISAAGAYPAISRANSPTGCYRMFWTEGNSVRWRSFIGSSATSGTLSSATNAFARAVAPTNLSVELDPTGTPALTWQEGSSVYFGVPEQGGAAAQVSFVSPARTVAAGGCSEPVRIKLEDACGDGATLAAPFTVSLSSTSGTTQFFSDSACTVPVSSLDIAAGQNSASFRFLDSASGGPTLTASGVGITQATQAQVVAP